MASRRADVRRGAPMSEPPSLRSVTTSAGDAYVTDVAKKQRRGLMIRPRKIAQVSCIAAGLGIIALVVYQVALIRPFPVGSPSGPYTYAEDLLLDTAAADAAKSRRPNDLEAATELIVVAGHAIYTGDRFDRGAFRNEDNWFLESFQKGMVDTFIEHIRKGVQLTANNSNALLLFSGGVTRPGVGPRSEAVSYWQAAESFDWFGFGNGVKNRSHVEEYARDSLENILFSVCRFSQLTGRYPEKLSVISFEVKRERFTTVHRQAIRFPLTRFEFYGVDPPGAADELGTMYERERARSLVPFGRDPYGCMLPSLYAKRLDRNPTLRFHPYPQGCSELAGLFRHCSKKLYSGSLPWDSKTFTTAPPVATFKTT